MPLTTVGRDYIAKAITNEAGTVHFDNANAAIGVGDSTTPFNVAQTDLQAATNKLRVGMDTGYPTVAANTITFRSTFDTSEGNFDWEEWGVFNNLTNGAGDMLQRKIETLGTKKSSQSWEITIAIDIAIG